MRKMRRGRFWRTVAVVVLALCMAFGVMPDVGMLQVAKPVEVQAAGNPDFYCGAYSSKNPFAQNGYYGQCTWYAWGRAFELTGKDVPARGNAGTWYDVARNAGWRVGSVPEANSIAVWSNGGVGHVAYVESVTGDSVTISEANWFSSPLNSKLYSLEEGKKWYNGRSTLSTAQMRSRYGTFLGYIYLGNQLPPGNRVIPDGDYFIVSAMEGKNFTWNAKCLTIRGLPGTKDISGANAELWPAYGAEGHIFTVTWTGDGFYRIKLKSSANQYLDAAGASTDVGTNVQQWEYNDTFAQQWRINQTGDGNGYTIQSRCNSWYVDVQDGNRAEGTNIRLWYGNESEAQRWYFTPQGRGAALTTPTPRTLSNGDYHIVSAQEGSRFDPGPFCVTPEFVEQNLNKRRTPMCTWPSLDWPDTVFTVTWSEKGYTMKVKNSADMYLDVRDGSMYKEAIVQQDNGNGSSAQLWQIEQTDDGNGYAVRSRHNGWYLDLANGKTGDGSQIRLLGWNGSAAQRWYFIPYGGGSGARQEIPDGEYQIFPKLDSTKVLSTQGNGVAEGTNVQLWAARDDGTQTFQVKWLGEGYYAIKNRHSGLVLDVENAVSRKGVNVALYGWWDNHSNKKWLIKSAGDGFFYIVSQCNGLYLDLEESKTTNGTNVSMFTGQGGDNQKWKFIPYSRAVDATSVTLDKATLSLTENGRATLTATVSPSNATDRTITWASSNTAVASVDNSGTVTANKAGTVTITARTSNGKSASCTVTVAAAHVHSYGNSWKTGTGSHWKECSCGAKAEEAAHTFGWVTDNAATVDSTGVKHEECGVCGYKRNEGTVIPKLPAPTVVVSSITLDKATLPLIEGGRATLTATVSPSNATDKAITWASSNLSVASVDGSGIVTANQAGTATITASASNGKSATCTVTVAAAHVHSYGNSWKTGSGSHWKECSCGARAEETAHIFGWVTDRAATVESAGVKHEECQVCGYRRSEGTPIPQLPSPQAPRMRGDIDGDGRVNLTDLMLCLYHVSGSRTLGGAAFQAADVDGNGKVDLTDLMRLLYYVSGSRKTL